MIKIIKSGKSISNTVLKFKNFKCDCGCIFDFSEDDVALREKRLGGKWMIYCPECGAEIWFNPSVGEEVLKSEYEKECEDSYTRKLHIIHEDACESWGHLCKDLLGVITEDQAERVYNNGSVDWSAFYEDADK